MFWGIDLVTNRQTRDPATELAKKVVLQLRQKYNILLNADGPYSNILKYKPPLCFNKKNLIESVKGLEKVLTDLTLADNNNNNNN